MNDTNKTESTTSERAVYEPCPCREVVNTVKEIFGISPEVRQHLINSRVEFLKAIREALTQRIDRLSSQAQPGTKVAVE